MLMDKIRQTIKQDFKKQFGDLADEKDIELLSEATCSMLEHKMDKLCEIGKQLFLNNILLTHFFYVFEKIVSELEKDSIELQLKDMLAAKRMLSKGYIYEEMKFDKQLFQKYMKRKIVAESKELSFLLNSHINWMICFINAVLDGSVHKDSMLSEWIELTQQTEMETLHNDTYKKLSSSLKKIAKRLIEAYKSERYFYFSLLYRELMGYSSKMQNILILNFMSEEIISIYTDYITGLDNQFKLKKELDNFKDKYLFLIDIHNFKKINVTYGFDTGDEVLKSVAQKLKNIKECTAYRFIGNEFAIIVNNKKKPYEIIKELEATTCEVDGHSISLFFYGAFGKIGAKILEYTEYGLMEAKKLKNHIMNIDDVKNKPAFIANKAQDIFSINTEIKLAVASDRIVPYLQGIFSSAKTDKPAKYEALARIESMDGSILPPSKFLNVLKNTYLYSEATKILFFKCVDFVEKTGIEISFNLSMLDIVNPYTTKFLKSILIDKTNVANKITFEITEEEAVENFKEVKEFIQDIKKLGAKIAIDDFGSGYANYNYIFNMNPDYIKIDGGLVSEILTNENQVILIKSLVEMSRKIGIKTVAEFVDSKEKMEKLRQLGVDYFQGFYFHKPEPYKKVLQLN